MPKAMTRIALETVSELSQDNSLSKALSDLQREAIAEEMNNLY